jgi:alkanesulfonate monooxygenase SsuD/methylene tetrahydromethanopterin reductase-like flavin-dependent oxidoreductase (luciferase family)
MDVPRPTAAPPGRLVRLAVVLDTRNPVERLLDVARMCDRAGIGALWVEDAAEAPGRPDAGRSGAAPRPEAASVRPGGTDGPAGPAGGGRLDGWTALALLAGEARGARVGALLDAAEWAPERLARMAATLGARTGGRLELTLRADGAGLLAFREALAATTVPAVLTPSRGGDGPAIVPAAGPAFGSVALPAVPPTLAVEVAADELSPEVLVAVDDVLLPMGPPAATVAAAVAVRRAAAAAGRGRETLGVAARLPVSVGRTVAEAQARWDAEPGFAALGPPAETGLFGTLEQCHDRVIELAQAGVTELRCLLPNAIDVHDVIAQLTAMTIGSADKLVPGAPRTRVPEPPTGWGGRSRFPRPD